MITPPCRISAYVLKSAVSVGDLVAQYTVWSPAFGPVPALTLFWMLVNWVAAVELLFQTEYSMTSCSPVPRWMKCCPIPKRTFWGMVGSPSGRMLNDGVEGHHVSGPRGAWTSCRGGPAG